MKKLLLFLGLIVSSFSQPLTNYPNIQWDTGTTTPSYCSEPGMFYRTDLNMFLSCVGHSYIQPITPAVKYHGLTKWLAALANLTLLPGSLNATRKIVHVVGLGDSIMVGNGASNVNNGYMTLTKQYIASYGQLAGNWVPASSFTTSGSWTSDGTGPFGTGTLCGTSSATLTYSHSGSDTIRILYETNGNTGAWTVSDNSVSQGSTYGTSTTGVSFAVVTISLSAGFGSHSTVITAPSSSKACILGMDTYATTAGNTGGYIFANMAISGKKALDADCANCVSWLTAYAPDLVLVGFGTNDNTPTTESASAFSGYLKDILQAGIASGASTVFITPHPQCPSPTKDIQLQTYVDAGIVVANQLGVPVVDMFRRWGGSCTAVTNAGWLYTDNTHPMENGYFDYFEALAEIIFPYNPLFRFQTGVTGSVDGTQGTAPINLAMTGTVLLNGSGAATVSGAGDGLFTSSSFSWFCWAELSQCSVVNSSGHKSVSISGGPTTGVTVRWFAWGY